jgi:deaminated glutathione amidase
VKVAAVQMTSGARVDANLETARRLLSIAAGAGAKVAVLPENFALMGRREADKLAIAEDDGAGPIQDFLAEQAASLRLTIVAGTMPIRVPGETRVAAASLVFGEGGRRIGRYDKIHLFDVNLPGKRRVLPGERPRRPDAVPPSWIRHPGRPHGSDRLLRSALSGALSRAVAQGGGSAASCRRRSPCRPARRTGNRAAARAGDREPLLRRRRRAVRPSRWWVPRPRETYGDSLIVDWWGRVVTRLPRGEGCAISAEIDLAGRLHAAASGVSRRCRTGCSD